MVEIPEKTVWLSLGQPRHSSNTYSLKSQDVFEETDLELLPRQEKIGSDDSFDLVYTETPLKLKENFILKTACLHLVKNCIDQLRMFVALNKNKVGEITDIPFRYQTPMERFDSKLQAKKYHEYVIGDSYTDFHKLQRDVKDAITVFEYLYDEFDIFSLATCLDTFADNYQKMKDDEAQLVENYEEKKQFFLWLINSMKNGRIEHKKDMEAMDAAISEMYTQMKIYLEYCNASTSYTKRWEAARQEQNSIVLQNREKHFISLAQGNRSKMILETICHENMEKICVESRDDYQDEINRWMEQYDKEYEDRENEILKMRHKISTLQDKKEKMREQMEERAKEMEAWIECKRKKREKKIKDFTEKRAARKIQAWWREVMIRKHLGPYGKKKRGKQGDKKNKNSRRKK